MLALKYTCKIQCYSIQKSPNTKTAQSPKVPEDPALIIAGSLDAFFLHSKKILKGTGWMGGTEAKWAKNFFN